MVLLIVQWRDKQAIILQLCVYDVGDKKPVIIMMVTKNGVNNIQAAQFQIFIQNK